jgi:hypothetical protein
MNIIRVLPALALCLMIKHDSDLDPLRNHPRYQKILELIG